MPAASFIDSFLTAPFSRKTDFHTAFKASVEAAGFPSTDIDVFDINDQNYVNSFGVTNFQAGAVGSLRGFVKEIVFNGSSKGTVQICFFTRTVWNNSLGGFGGSGNPYNDQAFAAGCFVVQGGWNSTTRLPNSSLSTIGGYTVNGTPADSASINWWGLSGATGPMGVPLANAGGSGDRIRCIYNMTNPIRFTAINHGEIRGVYIQQAEKLPQFVGLIRPANKPAGWNENNFPYCFTSENSSFFRYRSFYGAQSPYNVLIDNPTLLNFPGCTHWLYEQNSQTITEVGMGRGSNSSVVPSNPINPANNNKRDLLTAPYLLNNTSGAGVESGKWLVGQFSDDIVVSHSRGLDFRDKMIVSPGTEEYTVITSPEIGNYSGSSTISYRKYGDTTFYAHYLLGIRTT
jgi:hypothetical protein